MSTALDVGAFRLKSLACRRQRLIGRKCRTVHSVLPNTPARRQALEQMRVSFGTCGESLIAVGDSAVQVSQVFGTALLPLLPEGKLPQDDPPARQILATLVDAALPDSSASGEFCSVILPGGARSSRGRASREYEFFSRLVRLRGYTPLPLDAGLAVVLAALGACGFTGIGMSFGANSTQVTLAWQGRELASCSIPAGGDWIDEQMAQSEGAFTWDSRGIRFADLSAIRRAKENCDSVANPATRRDARINQLYRELLSRIATDMTREFIPLLPGLNLRRRLSVAAAGGPARIGGFRDLLADALLETPLPISPDEIRVPHDADYVIARGGLVYAQLEAETAAQGSAA